MASNRKYTFATPSIIRTLFRPFYSFFLLWFLLFSKTLTARLSWPYVSFLPLLWLFSSTYLPTLFVPTHSCCSSYYLLSILSLFCTPQYSPSYAYYPSRSNIPTTGNTLHLRFSTPPLTYSFILHFTTLFTLVSLYSNYIYNIAFSVSIRIFPLLLLLILLTITSPFNHNNFMVLFTLSTTHTLPYVLLIGPWAKPRVPIIQMLVHFKLSYRNGIHLIPFSN